MTDQTILELVQLLKAEKAEKEAQFRHMSRLLKAADKRVEMAKERVATVIKQLEARDHSVEVRSRQQSETIRALREENASLCALLDSQLVERTTG